MFINNTLLGSTFVQDPNPNYIKIDNVVLGETASYGYNVVNTNDIGALLLSSLNDNNIVVIVYNWSQKVAYIKTGFNLNDSTDFKTSAGFTSFIVTNRISAANLTYTFNNISVNTDAALLNINGHLKTNMGVFTLNQRTFVPVGMNAFFLGLLQETNYYPTHQQITEIFEAARTLGATVIRSHTLGFSAESSVTLLDGNNNINPAAWDPIDFAYSEAKRCSIKLIIVLCDPYSYYHGSINTFCAPYNISKDQFFTDNTARSAFKKYLNSYLLHVNPYTNVAIKDAVEVAFLELGNELGNIRPGAGSNSVPTQDWIQDITTYIKSIDQNHLVLNGSDECLGSGTSNDFAVNSLDTYSAHFYWGDYNRMTTGSTNAANNGKGYIIGEYSSQFDNNWFKTIEGMQNVKGTCAWSIYPHDDGTRTGTRINHGDGFTFWMDYNTDGNNIVLLNLTNHFRRMQGQPEIVMDQLGQL